MNLDFNKGNMQFSADEDEEDDRDEYGPNEVLVDEEGNLIN
jgi:hypothetical protein